MMQAVDKIAEAKTRWMSFCTHIGYSMLAGEMAVAFHVTGDRRRSQAETRIAIGEAAAVISRALEFTDADPTWAPVCDAMMRAADIHVAGLEAQLSEFRRFARIRTQPSRYEQKQLAEIAIHWTAAIFEARSIYAAIGGDPDDMTTFTDFYERMKAGGLSVLPPLAVPPWPAMEN